AMPLREWAPRIEHALIALLEPAQDSLGEASLSALEAIGQQLRTLASLPASLDAKPVLAHEAISLVLAQLASASTAPEPAAEELDLLGWLELPLDPSPKLVVMGVHDSTLPVARPPGPLLTEGLRRALGLPGESRALARDAASMAMLLAGNREVRFVLGTSNAAGDPLLPSTLLLRRSGDGPARVLARVREAFETLPASDAAPRCSFRVGVMTPAPPLERMAVTSFKTYLESPYLFFLKHALKLREVEPAGIVPRLEANTFGTLLHEALRTFSADESTCEVTSEGTIRQLMHAALWDATERFAGKTQSAIMLAQIDAAERRLASLAALEAQRRSAGWRTIAVEWKPDEPIALLDTGVGLTGSIDRIDWNEEHRTLALLDYKTSEDGRKPNSTHRRRDGSWTDLQLPLYELLAMPIASAKELEHPPTLGYIALTRTDARLLDADWDEAIRQSAVDCAVDVARTVRRGIDAMRELGAPAYESALTRLAGVGLLLDPEHDMLREGVAQ
ncbi:MAG: PD-(D/E)XK nuclease family protein, partial [Phycisphaerales bacterium JB064]